MLIGLGIVLSSVPCAAGLLQISLTLAGRTLTTGLETRTRTTWFAD